MALNLLPGESDMLAAVVDNLTDDVVKLVYADWLDDHGDHRRAKFLRTYVEAAREMWLINFPHGSRRLEEWLDLIGFRLVEQVAIAHAQQPPAAAVKLKKKLLPLARSALRMKPTGKGSRNLAGGASKIGGLPDLPPGFAWPLGRDCRAIYNSSTARVDELAGFVAQVNFAEIAGTQAARSLDLPAEGVLSFFSYTDADDPDTIGAMAAFFPDPSKLVATTPPRQPEEGNRAMKQQRLVFEETLDIPTDRSGDPWKSVWQEAAGEDSQGVKNHYWGLNLRNLFGYARSTSGGDPTPSKASRHLIVLDNACGCRLHIQIPAKALAARDFGAITLNWVDFD